MNVQVIARLRFLHKVLIVLYAFTLPIYSSVSIKILFVLLILSVFLSWKNLLDKELLLRYKYPLIFIAAVAIGLLYSTDWNATLSFVSEKAALSLAFLAIAIPLTSKDEVKRTQLSFAFGTAVAGVICLAQAMYRDYTEGAYWAYHHLDFTHILGLHPVYMGYYVNFSIIIVAYYLLDHTRLAINGRNIAAVSLIGFYVLMHVFLAGRIPLIAIVVSLAVWVAFKGLQSFRHWKLVVLTGILAATMIYFFGARTAVLDRFKDLFVPQQAVTDTAMGGYLERLMLWNAAINANTSVVFGVGHGDAQPILTEYYKTHNFDPSYVEENYNAHNQYLQTYLGSGLIGLAALICLVFVPTVLSFRSNDFIAFMFFSGFVFYCVTEVVLARYQGAAFYFFFYPLLYPALMPRK